MAIMRRARTPLYFLLDLLPAASHALAIQARHPSIFAEHALTFTDASAPLLSAVGPLLPTSFPHLTYLSLREQPLPNIDSDALFRGVGGLPRLAHLDMSRTAWSNAAAAAAATHLPAATTLETLTLKEAWISGAALATLVAALRTLCMLRELAVGSTEPNGDFSAAVAYARAVPNLHRLTLNLPNSVCKLFPQPPGRSLQRSVMHVLQRPSLRGLQWLRCLHISSSQPLSTRQLCGVSALKQLEDLQVATWDESRHGDPAAPRGDELMHVLACLPSLTALDVGMSVLTEPVENAFLTTHVISRLTALQLLRIEAPHAVISDSFLAGIGADHAVLSHTSATVARGLREVTIRGAEITAAGAQALTHRLRVVAPRLEVLQLDAWPVDDEEDAGAPPTAALRSLAALTALTALRLARCRFTDGDAVALAACMVHMHALQEVSLGCTRMSPAGCGALADALSTTAAPIRCLRITANGGRPQRELAALSCCLPRMHALQELELSCFCLNNPAAVDAFAVHLAAVTRLTKLRMDSVGVWQAACDRISHSLSKLTNLRRLEVADHWLGGALRDPCADAPFPQALAALSALTALCCSNCRGMCTADNAAAGVMRAAAVSSGHSLRELRMTDCCMLCRTARWERLPLTQLPQNAPHAQKHQPAYSFSGSSQAVGDICAALGGLRALETLDLSGSGALGDEFGVCFVRVAPQLPDLRRVVVTRCGIAARGSRALLQWLPGAPCMQQLKIDEFVVSDAEVSGAVRSALSCCHVG